jgi:hypothetical protein
MTKNEPLDFPGIEEELPTAVGPFELVEYDDVEYDNENGRVTVQYEVESAWLRLNGYYDTESGKPEASEFWKTPFRICLGKWRGENACPRRYTDSFESAKTAVKALEQVAARYREGTLYEENDYRYLNAVYHLLEEYAVDYRIPVAADDWPSEFLESSIGLYDKDAEQLVADLNILQVQGEKTMAFFTAPAGYRIPTKEPPLSEIEDTNKLPEPGIFIYEIFDIVGFIGMSPHPESTNMRKVRSLLEKLHIKYDYHPDLAWQDLIGEAQQRGHLVEEERHETENYLPSEKAADDAEEDIEGIEEWF